MQFKYGNEIWTLENYIFRLKLPSSLSHYGMNPLYLSRCRCGFLKEKTKSNSESFTESNCRSNFIHVTRLYQQKIENEHRESRNFYNFIALDSFINSQYKRKCAYTILLLWTPLFYARVFLIYPKKGSYCFLFSNFFVFRWEKHETLVFIKKKICVCVVGIFFETSLTC